MSLPEIFVVIPTFNEADNINKLLTQLLALPAFLGILIVDDNSPDGTGELADQWAAKQPERVYVLHRAGKLGLGTAYIAGFKQVLSHLPYASRIMAMDADFSHNPSYIPGMLEMSKEKHIVIGSRYVSGGGQRNCSPARILLSKGANWLTRTVLGLQATDTTASFRVYHREVLASIPLDNIFSNGYSFLVELLFMCQRRGWQIGEVPIIYDDRRFGQTKISRGEIFKAQYTVWRLFWRRLRGTEPRKPTIPFS